MTKKKQEKNANDMTDEELLLSVFPPHVVERIKREALGQIPEPRVPPIDPMKTD